MKIQCSCGQTVTRNNSRYLGLMEGSDIGLGYELDLYDCFNCGSCCAHRVYTEEGIVSVEMDLIRRGFAQDVDSVKRNLKAERLEAIFFRETAKFSRDPAVKQSKCRG